MTPLRFGTLNLLSGRSVDDGLVVPDRLHRGVAALDVDVLAVQEVDRGQARSGGVDPAGRGRCGPRRGGRRLRPHPARCAGPGRAWPVAEGPPTVWTPEGSAEPRQPGQPGEPGPSYGVGLVSRWAVLAWRVRRFAAARGVLPLAVPGPDGRPRLLVVPAEPRVALAAVVRTPAGPVTVVSTHLSFVPFAAVRQLRAVARWASTMPAPRLLLGDLNLPGPLPAWLTGWARLGRRATFPAAAPRLQLDHALGHGWPAGLVVETATPRAPLSDHRPLLLRLG